jgi:hypothetical protein
MSLPQTLTRSCALNRDVPENGVHNGREQLANHRRPDHPEEVKWLQLRKHSQQCQTVNAVVKPVA